LGGGGVNRAFLPARFIRLRRAENGIGVARQIVRNPDERLLEHRQFLLRELEEQQLVRFPAEPVLPGQQPAAFLRDAERDGSPVFRQPPAHGVTLFLQLVAQHRDGSGGEIELLGQIPQLLLAVAVDLVQDQHGGQRNALNGDFVALLHELPDHPAKKPVELLILPTVVLHQISTRHPFTPPGMQKGFNNFPAPSSGSH